MKTFEFDIRLLMYEEDGQRTIYVDELQASDQEKICKHLHGDYDWFAPDMRMKGYSPYFDEYYTNQQKYRKEFYGFNSDDVIMNAEFKNGKLHVTLVSTIDFDTVIKCHKYSLDSDPIWMTLLDSVKFRINGALSDGIGENPIGENIMYDFSEWSVELAELESSDPLCGMYGEEHQSTFFKINLIK